MLTQLRNLKEARGLPKHIRTNSEETSDLLHFIGHMSFMNRAQKFKKEVGKALYKHPFRETVWHNNKVCMDFVSHEF